MRCCGDYGFACKDFIAEGNSDFVHRAFSGMFGIVALFVMHMLILMVTLMLIMSVVILIVIVVLVIMNVAVVMLSMACCVWCCVIVYVLLLHWAIGTNLIHLAKRPGPAQPRPHKFQPGLAKPSRAYQTSVWQGLVKSLDAGSLAAWSSQFSILPLRESHFSAFLKELPDPTCLDSSSSFKNSTCRPLDSISCNRNVLGGGSRKLPRPSII